MSRHNIIVEYAKLLRLWNGLIAALGVLPAVLLATGWEGIGERIEDLLIGIVVVILFVGAGNALNDYSDIKNDRAAHPRRPLVTGTISRKSALYSSATLFALCLILSAFLNFLSASIVVLALIAMIAYEQRLKDAGFVGNITIALLVAALFIFSGAIMDGADRTLILASLACLATLGREIVKDVQDIEGDISRKSLPKRIGSKKAGYIALIAILAAVALSTIPYLLDQLTIAYLYIVLVADALFIIGGVLQLRNPLFGQNLFKVAMIVALAAFVVGVPI